MSMTPRDIARMLDHSTLQPNLTDTDINKGCDIALLYETATVCARPSDVKILVRKLTGSTVKACTVIGFPHGAQTSSAKLFEAEEALAEGCAELDMVINIGKLLSGDMDYIENEIRLIASAAHKTGALLKVIIETCYLTDEQKIAVCKLAEKAKTDFVKTSTGYGNAGCTIHDLKLMRGAVSGRVRVKGSGGIRDLDTVLSAAAAGAARCGVSATEAIMNEAEKRYREGTLTGVITLTEMNGAY